MEESVMEQSVPVRRKRKKKIKWIEFARACAILIVVMCHSLQNVWNFSMDAVRELDVFSKTAGFALFTIGRMSVPLFLMISGYLQLDKEYDAESCKRFWKRGWLPLYLVCALWIVIYHVFMIFTRGQDFNVGRVISEMLMLEGTSMSHMWYIPMVIGLNILIPFVAMALRAFSLRTLLFPLLVYIAYCFGAPTLNNVFQSLYIPVQAINMYQGFSGGMYGIYLIMGYLVKKDVFKRIPTAVVLLIEFVSLAGIVGFKLMAYHLGHLAYSLWVDNLFLLIGCTAVFEWMSRLRRIPCYRTVAKIAKYSFAIFLLHNMVIEVLAPLLTQLPIHDLLIELVLSVAVLLISLLIAYIITWIPKVGKAILLMK